MARRWGSPRGYPRFPVSPVLFAIYIAEIHDAVLSQVEDSRGISFVDDVTWLVEGVDIDDMAGNLERATFQGQPRVGRTQRSLLRNVEDGGILFSRKRSHCLC